MAAGVLPAPGAKYGPCEASCEHRDCAFTRRMAQSTCRFCGTEIGYDRRFYNDPQTQGAFVHADCIEAEVEAER